jgi:transposase
MSAPTKFPIKESISEIKSLLRKSSDFLAPHLRMLLECKKHETEGISKRVLAEAIGVNHNSIQTWRAIYIKGGITALLSHNKTGFKPSVFNQQDHDAIKEKLHDAEAPVIGFVELQRWIKENLDKDILYTTVVSYAKRHFNAKVKVARKSHIDKDKEAVGAFKKTSVKSVSKSLKIKKKDIRR